MFAVVPAEGSHGQGFFPVKKTVKCEVKKIRKTPKLVNQVLYS